MQDFDRAEYENLAAGAEYALQRLADDEDFQWSPADNLRPSIRAKALLAAMEAIENSYRGLQDYIRQAATVALADGSLQEAQAAKAPRSVMVGLQNKFNTESFSFSQMNFDAGSAAPERVLRAYAYLAGQLSQLELEEYTRKESSP